MQAALPNKSQRQLRQALQKLRKEEASDPLKQIELLCCVEEHGRHWAFLTKNYYPGVQDDTLRMQYGRARDFYGEVVGKCGRLAELKPIDEWEIDMLFVLVALMKHKLDAHRGEGPQLPEVLRMPAMEKEAGRKLQPHQVKFFERACAECKFDSVFPLLLNMCNLKRVHDKLLLFEVNGAATSLFDLLLKL